MTVRHAAKNWMHAARHSLHSYEIGTGEFKATAMTNKFGQGCNWLGVQFFEKIAGERPFSGKTAKEGVAAQ